LNIANYAHLHDYYLDGNDTLTLDYYVLDYNAKRASTHFLQVKPMIACYEKYFGKYAFYKDGYKLVETNYWGMEHQSCVAYGNEYKNNKFGFDFIIIHESGHEWWGNHISCSDEADMWIHESFTTYAEALYLECRKGYDTAVKYLLYQENKIVDKYPIIGPYNVNFQGTSDDNDMYYKGTWMLHTFRHVVDNDSLFFGILKGLQNHFSYQSTCTDSVVAYINKASGKNYTPFFTEYLKYAAPPEFAYEINEEKNGIQLKYKWVAGVKDFNMPVKITSAIKDGIKTYITVTPTSAWQTISLPNIKASDFSVDTDEFYVTPEMLVEREPQQ
jgi:aminopeptidase N